MSTGASTMFTSTLIICRIIVGFIMPVARSVANIATIDELQRKTRREPVQVVDAGARRGLVRRHGAHVGPETRYTPTNTTAPIASDSTSDWLNTRLARSRCCAPTACETSATVPTFRICVSASTTNQMLPAEVTPAMAASPSFDTKNRSVKKYSVCTRMPMPIWMDIVVMWPGIEPVLRSFMRRTIARTGPDSMTGRRLVRPLRTKKKAGHGPALSLS